ncbi:MAG: zinc-binding dehydrogenase [Bacteroidota bacterium]
MRAVFLTSFGKAQSSFEIRETEKPKCKESQVLIQVEAFGLNFADVLARTGMYPETPPTPCIIGYEVVGRIEEGGSEVPGELIGKRVVALTRFGGYAEYAVTDYRALAVISEDADASEALALGTQGTTAYVCLEESMKLYSGDKVLVHAAAGGVGLMLCQFALSKGCTVFGTASQPEKLEYLRSIGVQHPINYREKDYSAEISMILGKERIDASFNSLAGKSVKKDLKLLGAGGKLVIFGAASRAGGSKGILSGLKLLWQTGFYTPLAFIMRSKAIIGINILKLGDYKPQLVAECMSKTVALAEQGVLKPKVHKTYSVEELAKAHSALENRGTIGKVAIRWN